MQKLVYGQSLTFVATDTFWGQVDKNDVAQGVGREITVDDIMYEGEWKDNKYHGFGRSMSKSEYYEGFWQDGLMHGCGQLCSDNSKHSLVGNWIKGEFQLLSNPAMKENPLLKTHWSGKR